MKGIEKMISLVLRYPGWILAAFALLTTTMAAFLPGLTRDPSPYLLARTHESRVNLERLRSTYTGARDSILVLLEADDTVFRPRTLMRIHRLTESFEKISLLSKQDLDTLRNLAAALPPVPRTELLARIDDDFAGEAWELLEEIGVMLEMEGRMTDDTARILDRLSLKMMPVLKVTSLANTDNITGNGGTLDVGPIYDPFLQPPGDPANMKTKVWDNELFRKILVSEDGRRTSIFLELAVGDDAAEEQLQVYERVKQILETDIPGDETHYVGGLPVVTATIGKTMQTDTRRLFPMVFLLVIICLWVTFRMVKGVVVPLLVVLLSLVITMSLMAALKIPINIVTTALPIFIISIGVADGIHIFSEYRDHLLDGSDKRSAVKKTMRHLTLPVAMTSLTTAAAFWSLSITEIVQMKHFGLFVAAGTLFAMTFSLLFVPALLLVLPEKKERPGPAKKSSRLDRYTTSALQWISRQVMAKPWVVVTCAVLIMAMAGYGTTLVRVDNDSISYLPGDSDIVISTGRLNADGAGSLSLNLLIRAETDAPEPLKDPERLAAISRLTDRLADHALVGKTLGLPQLIRRINLVMHDGSPAYNRIPAKAVPAFTDEENLTEMVPGRDLISQYLLLYENSGGDTLTDVIDTGFRQAHVTVILKTNSSREIQKLIKDIRTHEKIYFPGDMKIDFSGSAYVTVASTFEIVNGQVVSLMVSFLLIFCMLVYTFRSISKGLFAMIPLGATVLVNFGIMGIFVIPLDIGTAVVSSIVIGIGVDYSIHYLTRLRENLKQGLGFEAAVLKTVRHSGRAIAANAFTVGIGFTALLFSVFSPLVTMGWMITTTMFVSAIAAIILFPALLSIFPMGFVPLPAKGSKTMPVKLLPEK